MEERSLGASQRNRVKRQVVIYYVLTRITPTPSKICTCIPPPASTRHPFVPIPVLKNMMRGINHVSPSS
jgi:hypothetical protein